MIEEDKLQCDPPNDIKSHAQLMNLLPKKETEEKKSKTCDQFMNQTLVELINTSDNFSFKEDKTSYFQKYIDEENFQDDNLSYGSSTLSNYGKNLDGLKHFSGC
jgi:hypothetical protein